MKTKSTTKKRKYGKSHASPPPRRRIGDRDLNEDEQNRRTNVSDAEDDTYRTRQDHEVEEEEEREKKRRVEDARGEAEN
jgi:hypothetical protein